MYNDEVVTDLHLLPKRVWVENSLVCAPSEKQDWCLPLEGCAIGSCSSICGRFGPRLGRLLTDSSSNDIDISELFSRPTLLKGRFISAPSVFAQESSRSTSHRERSGLVQVTAEMVSCIPFARGRVVDNAPSSVVVPLMPCLS